MRESGRYTETGDGPVSDSASWDRRTPMGGDSYRGSGDEPVYVIDERELEKKQAEEKARAMLSRKELIHGGGPVDEVVSEPSKGRVIAIGLVLTVVLLALGIYGVWSANRELDKLDEAIQAEVAAKPPPPEDVQGVRVRKGMKHNPLAPAKKPGSTIDEENPMPLNAVPEGEAPPDPVVRPPEPASGDVPSGEVPP